MYYKLLMCVFLTTSLYAQTWTEYESEIGGFRIELPSKPDIRQQTIATDVAEIDLYTMVCKPDADDPNFLYLINFCDYPPETFHADSTTLLADFFASSIEEVSANVGGEVIYTSDTNVDGYPAKLARIEYADHTAVIKTQIVLMDHRFYALQVFSTIERSLNDDVDRFLRSFRIGANER